MAFFYKNQNVYDVYPSLNPCSCLPLRDYNTFENVTNFIANWNNCYWKGNAKHVLHIRQKFLSQIFIKGHCHDVLGYRPIKDKGIALVSFG